MREFVSFRVASTDNAQFTILIISYHYRQRSDCNLDRYGYLVRGLLHEAIQYKGRTLSIDVNICADAGQTGLAIRRIAYSIGKKKTSLQPRPYDFNVQRFGKKVPPGSTLLATARNESHRDGPSGLRSCNRRGGYYRWCGH